MKARLKADFIKGMKTKDKDLKLVVSAIRGAIQYAESKTDRTNKEADDKEILQIISKCAKECKETLTGFIRAGAGYEDKIAEERRKLALYESYLPQKATIEQMQDAINKSMAEGASSIGEVMRSTRATLQEQELNFDGKVLSEIVKQSL